MKKPHDQPVRPTGRRTISSVLDGSQRPRDVVIEEPRLLSPPPSYVEKYCEENVWQLARHPSLAHLKRHAIFVSNAGRVCPMWQQRAVAGPNQPVFWDYHVVLLVEGGGGAPSIWDLDTRLPLPCPAPAWLDRTFPLGLSLPVELQPRFRIVEAHDLFTSFASDRSHMRAPDGSWQATPPAWPPIRTATETMTLMSFVDMERPFVGKVLDLAGMRAFVSS